MINTVKGLSQVQKPQPQQTCMHQWLYARNQQHTIAHFEWNNLGESQTDMVKIDHTVKSMKLSDHELHILKYLKKLEELISDKN